MKTIHILFAMAALALIGTAYAAEKNYKPGGCCDKAAKKGEKCAHPCCVDAEKENKVCAKCNPEKK